MRKKASIQKDIAIYANLSFADGNKPDAVNLFPRARMISTISEPEITSTSFLIYRYKRAGMTLRVILPTSIRVWALQFKWSKLLDASCDSTMQNTMIHLCLTLPTFSFVDSQSVFADAIGAVKDKLRAEGAPIEITDNFGGGAGGAEDPDPEGWIGCSHPSGACRCFGSMHADR